MNIVPLGTNGFFSSFGRQTMCFAVPLGKTLIILDAGSGLFRLAEPEGKKVLDDVETIHLYLSHYHLDHTFGFYAAPRLLKDKSVTVYGKHPKRVFEELYSQEYVPGNFRKQFSNFSWEEVSEKETKRDGYIVTARKQFHNGAGSLSFRFSLKGKSLAYITDSEPTRESVEFVKGVNVLLHEHYLPGDEVLKTKHVRLEDHFLGGHVTTVGAATIAKKAKVGKLALVHHFPFADEKQLEKQLVSAKNIFPRTSLSQDGKPLQF